MSEWKTKLKRQTSESEDYFCTRGWGMSDGIVELFNLIQKRRREKKAKKANKLK